MEACAENDTKTNMHDGSGTDDDNKNNIITGTGACSNTTNIMDMSNKCLINFEWNYKYFDSIVAITLSMLKIINYTSYLFIDEM